MRARKRKADVATFLQDPDEEIAQMEMTRKKQYVNQYLIITNMVQRRYGYLQLYSYEQGGLSSLAAEVFKTLQFTHVALEPVQEMRPELV